MLSKLINWNSILSLNNINSGDDLAESEGFEPPVPCETPVFKTGTLDHSVNSPN